MKKGIGVRMPLNLKNKLVNTEGFLNSFCKKIEINTLGSNIGSYIQGPQYNEFELDLDNDVDSLNACYEWFEDMIKIDIGSFKGIVPVCITDSVVTFNVNEINFNAKDWREWFIQDEMYIEGSH